MSVKKTANLFVNFTLKRLAEILGVIVFCSGIFLMLALLTYSPNDPNFIFPDNTEIKNNSWVFKEVLFQIYFCNL